MKKFRKWNRILHRDIGFFFVGTTIIYSISGIALNHIKDWDPNYIVNIERFTTDIDFSESQISEEKIFQLLDEVDDRDNYKSYNYVDNNEILRIYLGGRSSVTIRPETGEVMAEFVKKRAVFYQSNYLHYNPNRWWMWFSDIFAGALIFLALSSLFMLRGRKSAWGRGGIYIALGIIIPVLFLIFLS